MLEQFRADLHDYFGSITETQIPGSSKPLKQPELFTLWKQTKKMGLPLFEGGLVDQPYLWIEICGIIEDAVEFHKIILDKPVM